MTNLAIQPNNPVINVPWTHEQQLEVLIRLIMVIAQPPSPAIRFLNGFRFDCSLRRRLEARRIPSGNRG